MVRKKKSKAGTHMMRGGHMMSDAEMRRLMGAGAKTHGKKLYKKGGRFWIQDAIKKPGALRRTAGVKKGQKIPTGKLARLAGKPGVTGKRARLAQTLRGFS